MLSFFASAPTRPIHAPNRKSVYNHTDALRGYSGILGINSNTGTLCANPDTHLAAAAQVDEGHDGAAHVLARGAGPPPRLGQVQPGRHKDRPGTNAVR
jgi:hypothetical protein